MKQIFCHDLICPPSQNRKSNVDIKLINSKNHILIRNKRDSFETVYIMIIKEPLSIGFTGDGDGMENKFKNLILAFNLHLHRICINYYGNSQFSPFDIKPDISNSKSTNRKIGNAFHADMLDSIVKTNGLETAIRVHEEIDETAVIDSFHRLQKVKRFDINKNLSIKETNLKNAFQHYENSMQDYHRLFKFKHLYNALEIITNTNGTDRKGDSLDKRMHILSGNSIIEIRRWRAFYNRIKHTQRNSSDIKVHYDGIGKLHEDLLLTRKCFQKIILSVL